MSFDILEPQETIPLTEAQLEVLIQELKKYLGLIKFRAKLGDSEDLQTAIVDDIGADGKPRKGFVRVRLQNDSVPYRVVKSGLLGGYNPDAGTPVVLFYDDKGDLAIFSMDHDGIREAKGNPLIYNTGDRRMSAFTQTDGLMPLFSGAVSEASGTLTNEIFVDKFRFVSKNIVKEFPGITVDLSSLVPAAGLHRYVGVFLRISDLVIEAVGSSTKPSITPLTDTDKQEVYDGRSAESIPVALWRLHDAQTSIKSSDKIEDLRPWLSSLSTESGQNIQNVTIKSANYTLLQTDNVVVFTAIATATLPAATGSGTTYRIVCRDGGTTIDGNGTDTIKGEFTQTLSPGEDLIITDTQTGIWE